MWHGSSDQVLTPQCVTFPMPRISWCIWVGAESGNFGPLRGRMERSRRFLAVRHRSGAASASQPIFCIGKLKKEEGCQVTAPKCSTFLAWVLWCGWAGVESENLGPLCDGMERFRRDLAIHHRSGAVKEERVPVPTPKFSSSHTKM